MLAGVEEIKATQKVHSIMLQALAKQRNVIDAVAFQKLPEGLTLPLKSFEDVDNAEELLKDKVTQSTLVCWLL